MSHKCPLQAYSVQISTLCIRPYNILLYAALEFITDAANCTTPSQPRGGGGGGRVGGAGAGAEGEWRKEPHSYKEVRPRNKGT